MRIMILLTLICALIPALGQESSGQKSEEKEPSLAELARRERERKASLEKSPVITNATIRNYLGQDGSGTDAASGAEASQSHVIKGDPQARLTLIEFTDYQ